MPDTAVAFTRPNGKPYRPRKPELVAHVWENDHGYCGDAGAIVLGTLDPDTARPIAVELCRREFDADDLAAGQPGWFRAGFHHGEHRWFIDTEKGRPGVSFEVQR